MAFATSATRSLALRSAAVSPFVQSTRQFGVVNQSRVSMRAVWLPGAKPPAYLDGSLPADRGFDPLGLAKEPALLNRYKEAEVIHGRYAMLGFAGAVAPELLKIANWAEAAPAAVTGGSDAFLLGVPPIVVPITPSGLLVFHVIAILEGLRLKDEIMTGYEGNNDKVVYPGFDFLGVLDGADDATVADYRTREIKNGRLAMIACLGLVAQNIATGTGPVANLQAHLADPGHNWIFG